MTQEIWLPIPGYEGSYEISSIGRVKSLARVVQGRKGRRRSMEVRVLLPRYRGPYRSAVLAKDGVQKPWSIHSLVALAFIGPRPHGLQVCHGDGNSDNNHPTNLRYDTVTANHADRRKHGTLPLGERVGPSKLTCEQVREIALDHRTQRQVAKDYGVCKSTIGAIRRGEVWGHAL